MLRLPYECVSLYELFTKSGGRPRPRSFVVEMSAAVLCSPPLTVQLILPFPLMNPFHLRKSLPILFVRRLHSSNLMPSSYKEFIPLSILIPLFPFFAALLSYSSILFLQFTSSSLSPLSNKNTVHLVVSEFQTALLLVR